MDIANIVRCLQRLEPLCMWHKPATKIDRVTLARNVRELPTPRQHFGVSEKGIGDALRRMNITYKTTQRERTPPPSVREWKLIGSRDAQTASAL